MLDVFEICAGGGGQALGLERAGFRPLGLVENDRHACATLEFNRPGWPVIESDVQKITHSDLPEVDLLAGGVPCPPFSVAGRQLGSRDSRDLFPVALRLAESMGPKAVLLENVPGFAANRFREYRRNLFLRLNRIGYAVSWKVLNACDFGVPQLRPRFILVALKDRYASRFRWPPGTGRGTLTVGEALADLMAEGGWKGALAWTQRANEIAPTLVGGSKRHGGADLGPTRARTAWKRLGVNGVSLADEAPDADFPPGTPPRLTVRMTARLQGFPDSWRFKGGKTASYRQIGNALPPPVAEAVGRAIASSLNEEAAPLPFDQPEFEFERAGV